MVSGWEARAGGYWRQFKQVALPRYLSVKQHKNGDTEGKGIWSRGRLTGLLTRLVTFDDSGVGVRGEGMDIRVKYLRRREEFFSQRDNV